MSTITRVCCVCKRVIGIIEGYGVTGVSHGYCPTHLAVAQAALEYEDEGEPDVESYDDPPHNPDECTDIGCEEPVCVKAQRMCAADRRAHEKMEERDES